MQGGDEVLESWIVDLLHLDPFGVEIAQELIDIGEVGFAGVGREVQFEAKIGEELRANIGGQHHESENFKLSLQR